jgi:hypothetical protein
VAGRVTPYGTGIEQTLQWYRTGQAHPMTTLGR